MSYIAALLAMSYQKEEEKKAAKAAKPAKVKGIRLGKSGKSGKETLPAIDPTMPIEGSLDAEGFLLAVRDAGKREKEGRIIYHPEFSREDTIRAIAGFTGYDPRVSFGQQESAARQKASAILRPFKSEEYRRTLAPGSIGGFVAGMPKNGERVRENLLVREQKAMKAMAAFVGTSNKRDLIKAIKDHMEENADLLLISVTSLDDASCAKIAQELATLEETRLSQIQQDLEFLP